MNYLMRTEYTKSDLQDYITTDAAPVDGYVPELIRIHNNIVFAFARAKRKKDCSHKKRGEEMLLK